MAPRFQQVVEAAVLEQAVAEPRPAEQRDQHQPVDQQERARQGFEPGEKKHQRQEHQLGQRRGAHDVEQVRQRGVAPDAAIEPGQQKAPGRDGGECRAIEKCQPRLPHQHLVAEPQIERQREGQPGHRHVVQKGEAGARGIGKQRHQGVLPEISRQNGLL